MFILLVRTGALLLPELVTINAHAEHLVEYAPILCVIDDVEAVEDLLSSVTPVDVLILILLPRRFLLADIGVCDHVLAAVAYSMALSIIEC